MLTSLQRFFDKVNTGGECWVWTANRNHKGYGYFTGSGRLQGAHRWLYEQVNGSIPEGKEMDHLCRNRACVRLEHLEVVTHRENLLRGDTLPARLAARTHCKNGHPFRGNNLFTLSGGGRGCRACRAVWRRGYNLRRKERLARV